MAKEERSSKRTLVLKPIEFSLAPIDNRKNV